MTASGMDDEKNGQDRSADGRFAEPGATGSHDESVPQTLLWFGRFSGFGGLSDAALAYVEACHAADLPVVMIDTTTTEQVGPAPKHVVVTKSNGNLVVRSQRGGERFVTVFHDSPELLRCFDFEGAVRNIGFIVSETKAFPPQWALRLMDCHEVWTASDFNVQNISQSIPPFMVHKVPHSLPSALLASAPDADRQQSLTFGTLASRRDRRRVGQLVRVFQKARASGEIPSNAELVIKTSPTNMEDIAGVCRDADLAGLGEVRMLENVRFLQSRLTRQDVWEWLATIDVLVSTEWGKGWDLPAFYAMAMGKACVSTGFGGNTEFMTKENSVLMDHYLDYPDPEEAVNTKLYSGHKAGFVTDENLANGLREAVERREALARPELRKALIEKFSPESIGVRLRERLSNYAIYDYYGNGAPVITIRPFRNVRTAAAPAPVPAQAATVSPSPHPATERPLVHFIAKSLARHPRLFKGAQIVYGTVRGKRAER